MYEVIETDGDEVVVRNLNDGGIERVGVRDLLACANGGIRVGFTYGDEVIPYRFDRPVIDNSNLARMQMAGFHTKINSDGVLTGVYGIENAWVVVDDLGAKAFNLTPCGGGMIVYGDIDYSNRFVPDVPVIIAGRFSGPEFAFCGSGDGCRFVCRQCLEDYVDAVVAFILNRFTLEPNRHYKLAGMWGYAWNALLKEYLGLGDRGVVELYVSPTADLKNLRKFLLTGGGSNTWINTELRKCGTVFRKAYMLMRHQQRGQSGDRLRVALERILYNGGTLREYVLEEGGVAETPDGLWKMC